MLLQAPQFKFLKPNIFAATIATPRVRQPLQLNHNRIPPIALSPLSMGLDSLKPLGTKPDYGS